MEESGVDPEEWAEEKEELAEEGITYDERDEDGDGVVSDEEKADDAERKKEFADIPSKIDTEAVDKELEERLKAGKALLPSITVEHFRAALAIAKKVVVKRMGDKMAKKQAKKMATFAKTIFIFSLLGFLLLLMPLVLAKKYPGKMGVLVKYSALAAVTFFVLVNLFGGVLYGMRTVQGKLSHFTNPALAVVNGTFETLDTNAEDYAVMGKELFMPTIKALRGNTDEQPAVLILQNGQKVVKDAMVFVRAAKAVKKVMFVLDYVPIILFIVTLLLLVLAIRPTLMAIIKLPAQVAGGDEAAGGKVVKQSIARVIGEAKATGCTIGVLFVMTLISALVLDQIMAPAVDALLRYFSLSVQYLQYEPDASSGNVFLALFGVIFFLVINLGVLIVSMAFFIGKMQKIFQARFNHGMAISEHAPFIKWAIPSVLLVQLFPLIFIFVADKVLQSVAYGVTKGVTNPDDVAWGKSLVAGPLCLVVAFLVLFWAARGFKAIKYLFKYKVKPPVS